MEVLIERMMYASRWLLAPIYFGLSLALIALGIKFFQEIFHLLPHVLEISEADIVLVVLSLIDIALVSGLIIMVMFTSFISSARSSARRVVLITIKIFLNIYCC